MGRLIEALGLGQLHLFESARARLNFPDDLQFLTEGVVFDGGEADEVLGSLGDLAAIDAAAHVGHHVPPLAHKRQLPLLGNGT